MNKLNVLKIASPILGLITSAGFAGSAVCVRKARKMSEEVRPTEDEMDEEKTQAYLQADVNSAALEGLFAGASIAFGAKSITEIVLLFKK